MEFLYKLVVGAEDYYFEEYQIIGETDKQYFVTRNDLPPIAIDKRSVDARNKRSFFTSKAHAIKIMRLTLMIELNKWQYKVYECEKKLRKLKTLEED